LTDKERRIYLGADSSNYSECRACLLACSLYHLGENDPKKASLAIVPHFPHPGTFEVCTCTQCGECAEVCPVDCILQSEKGAYYIDAEEWSEGVLSIEELLDLSSSEAGKWTTKEAMI